MNQPNPTPHCEGPPPQPGDVWSFKLPGKRRRIKEVGRVDMKEFITERATKWPWKHKIERVPFVHWARKNKGRYTGITVKKLMEFGQRISTKAERDAHLNEMIERARAKREKKKIAESTAKAHG